MKMIKTSFMLFCGIALILLSSCRALPEGASSSAPEPEKTPAAVRDHITLLYSASDSFDPYKVKTEVNRQLCRLLYEPLVKTDNAFRPVYCLAQSAEIRGTTCTVTLKNRLFSDGTVLSAEDVVYSFGLAKNSESEYRYKLYEAASVSAANSATVVFKMTKADPYFLNLLDFPIIKRGSEKRTDTDSVSLPPIGCGRYVSDDARTKLTLNTVSFGNAAAIKEVRLINAPDAESVSHYVEVNAADLYYSDISDGKIIRMSGNKKDIQLNHLVAVAVNRGDGALRQGALRQALSAGIDREKICRESYYNNAIPANGFFNPVWEPVKASQNIETVANREISIANLEKIGYNDIDHAGIRKNANGSALSFRLIVNSENRMRVSAANRIAEALAECGIRIQVSEMKYADYLAALTAGQFQLALVEVAVTPNMDLSALTLEGGSAAFGFAPKSDKTGKAETGDPSDPSPEGDGAAQEAEEVSALPKLVEGFYNGGNTLADLSEALQNEMPFIPVCYRTGVLFYHDEIENVTDSSMSDIYFSITSYTIHQQ